jgi:hypothetical protein
MELSSRDLLHHAREGTPGFAAMAATTGASKLARRFVPVPNESASD